LPDDYVPDLRQKIDLYRRFGRIEDSDQLKELQEELLDRFGPPPPPVAVMFELADLRVDAAIWQIAGLAVEDERFLVLRYSDRRRIEQLAKQSRIPVRIVDQKKAYVPRKSLATGSWLSFARSVLRFS
jgi:transcription-repair coupling factor (superfamily II helicase)